MYQTIYLFIVSKKKVKKNNFEKNNPNKNIQKVFF